MTDADRADVLHRVDLPAAALGLDPPPPAIVSLRPVMGPRRWTFYLLFDPGRAPVMERWIRSFGPGAVVVAPGVFPRVLRAEFNVLPARWAWVEATQRLSLVSVGPGGVATVLLQGDHRALQALEASLSSAVMAPAADSAPTRIQTARAHRVRLTLTQRDVLNLAVSMGYYEMPRRTDLRRIAAICERSTGTIAELLRRAESKIVTKHSTQSLLEDWKAAHPDDGAVP